MRRHAPSATGSASRRGLFFTDNLIWFVCLGFFFFVCVCVSVCVCVCIYIYMKRERERERDRERERHAPSATGSASSRGLFFTEICE